MSGKELYQRHRAWLQPTIIITVVTSCVVGMFEAGRVMVVLDEDRVRREAMQDVDHALLAPALEKANLKLDEVAIDVAKIKGKLEMLIDLQPHQKTACKD